MSIPFGNPLLQVSPFASDGGAVIGRDPRDIQSDDWRGNPFLIGLKAIRAKCLDCAFDAKEVRKCVQTDCPLWPLRMGTVPKGFNQARQEAEFSEVTEERLTIAARMGAEKNAPSTDQNVAEMSK
ncbi:hypothetical protein [Tropicimonas sediminicola]|uniref:Uncharacterized protein n=1 Tax=Tropicimonas sediminicola TaxID=1031541 RepID=A0A239I088_9RHOB|nr:hypothetical protein [Tropicimonas sediminicola]SNS87206.1 hypothetical protein SAMN05421757_104139 [Tropicimonas sediminicola]